MSDKPKFEGREVENASPQQLREELEKYVQHMLGHDPDKLEFALMVTGHGEANGGTHVCSMIGGPPQTIAAVIMELMDELVKRNPVFAIFFLMNMIQRMRSLKGANVEIVDISKFDFDATGGPDVEAQVKDLISKLQGGTPPSGSVH